MHLKEKRGGAIAYTTVLEQFQNLPKCAPFFKVEKYHNLVKFKKQINRFLTDYILPVFMAHG